MALLAVDTEFDARCVAALQAITGVAPAAADAPSPRRRCLKHRVEDSSP